MFKFVDASNILYTDSNGYARQFVDHSFLRIPRPGQLDVAAVMNDELEMYGYPRVIRHSSHPLFEGFDYRPHICENELRHYGYGLLTLYKTAFSRNAMYYHFYEMSSDITLPSDSASMIRFIFCVRNHALFFGEVMSLRMYQEYIERLGGRMWIDVRDPGKIVIKIWNRRA